MKHQRLFIGTKTEKRIDWESCFATPDLKTDKGRRDREARREAEADKLPFSGTLTAYEIITADGDLVAAQTAHPDALEGYLSYRMINDIYDNLIEDPIPKGTFDIGAKLFGFDIHNVLQLVGVDALRYLNTPGCPHAGMPLPLSLWYHPPFTRAQFCDPLDIVVKSGQRADVNAYQALWFLNMEIPEGLSEDGDITREVSAAVQAETARQMTLCSQLFR